MCTISSAPHSHFIISDMSDNDVPIGNDNVEEAEGRIELLTVQLAILKIYIKKRERGRPIVTTSIVNQQSFKVAQAQARKGLLEDSD